METRAGRELLGRFVDYAGLFPPAARTMADAVTEYAAAQAGVDAWMLGRFVIPAGRLGELVPALGAVATGPRGWRLSAIVRDGSPEDRAAVEQFNAARLNGMSVDSVECRPESMGRIAALAAEFAGRFAVFVEVPAAPEASAWIARLAEHGLFAKVRTGGLAADAFPSPDGVLDFLEAAVGERVPFKATAGLHHATCGEYSLTDEPGAPCARMYGYLNLALATAALAQGLPRPVAADLLTRSDAASLALTDDAVGWGDMTISIDSLRRTRSHHLLSFGSCSFLEPAEEFRRVTDGSLSARR